MGTRTIPGKVRARCDHPANNPPQMMNIIGDYGMMISMLIEIVHFSKHTQTDVEGIEKKHDCFKGLDAEDSLQDHVVPEYRNQLGARPGALGASRQLTCGRA